MQIVRRPTTRGAAPVETSTASRTTTGRRTTVLGERRNRGLPRSRELLDALSKLDVTTDDRSRQAVLKFVGDLYSEAGGGVPIGLFAKCWLGTPYLDHIVDLGGSIVRHFKHNETVPSVYAAARPLARNDAYAFIEVYSDGTVIPVRSDGSPVN